MPLPASCRWQLPIQRPRLGQLHCSHDHTVPIFTSPDDRGWGLVAGVGLQLARRPVGLDGAASLAGRSGCVHAAHFLFLQFLPNAASRTPFSQGGASLR